VLARVQRRVNSRFAPVSAPGVLPAAGSAAVRSGNSDLLAGAGTATRDGARRCRRRRDHRRVATCLAGRRACRSHAAR
jgi:hypothetical protein